jgi:dTMP kinase
MTTCAEPVRDPWGETVGFCQLLRDHDGPCDFNEASRLNTNNFFIAIEGPDGAGKTTQAKRLKERLEAEDQPALYTNEPTKGPIGRLIRDMLSREISLTSADCMAMLFAADRLWHLDTIVLPALSQGLVVVTDRYDLSSLTYQAATGADLHRLRVLNEKALRPGLTIVLEISAEEQRERLVGNPDKLSVFDTDPDLQDKVRAAYNWSGALVPQDKVLHVDANGTEAEVAALIWLYVKGHLTNAVSGMVRS